MIKRIIYILFCVTFLGQMLFLSESFAAVGCTLNDPDRDIKRIFPKSTGYKTEFLTVIENGGEVLTKEIEEKLGDSLDEVYETSDVPYAYYTVLSKKEVIGYMHGVNQRGTYGGMQLILATDLDGKILEFYYQKILSPESKKFIGESFTNQFTGLTLNDFYNQTFQIEDPSDKSKEDFDYTMRGLKKNLILFDIFKLDRKYNK